MIYTGIVLIIGMLQLKLDTEFLDILLKSFPGTTAWAAYSTDLMPKVTTAFWFILI